MPTETAADPSEQGWLSSPRPLRSPRSVAHVQQGPLTGGGGNGAAVNAVQVQTQC